MADDFDRHWRKTVAAVKDTPDCPHCGRPPECAWDHTSGLWSVGCGKCDKPNNGVSDDILTAMASWREHTDAYRRNHDGEGLQNQLTEYWRKTRQVTAYPSLTEGDCGLKSVRPTFRKTCRNLN